MDTRSPIAEYLDELKAARRFSPLIVCHRTLPGAPPAWGDPAVPLAPPLAGGLRDLGVERLYSHQAEALDIIRGGDDVVVSTATASGKSLIYNIPVIETHLDDPSAHALYLFPLKALAQDQLQALLRLQRAVRGNGRNEDRPFAAIYDGDTRAQSRARLRKKPPPVLITNPDMVHLSLLPYHDSWSPFFRNLRHVVVDEIHTYRGLFGSHMAWVLRRLQRIASHYGARPRFIMSSATIGNPKALGAALSDRDVSVVSESGAPRGARHFLLINPWDSTAHTAAQLLEAAVRRGLRTIVYTKSRKMTELITMWTKPRLGDQAGLLSSYRAGFLAEERRAIENDLARGKLHGVISTSALELGIDIGTLDLCILVGYPGSIMATWQRSGRVGRSSRESAVIMVGGEDALDQYFMRNPDDFFARPPENAALNPSNEIIAEQHLHCAAAEIALDRAETLLDEAPPIRGVVEAMAARSVLHQDRSGRFWYASRKRPQHLISLRGGGVRLAIIDRDHGEVIGDIDAGRALRETHPGAVYLHRMKTLLVDTLDIDAGEVIVAAARPNYYTRAAVTKDTEIIVRRKSRIVFDCTISWGSLRVTEQVTGFSTINNQTQKPISFKPLDLPVQTMETEGLWLDLPDRYRTAMEKDAMHFMGAIHALEHTMIAMFPLLILCDRNDIGGISCPRHEQTEAASIFIYDGYVGGAGLTDQAYGRIEELLRQTAQTIRSCPCETGCPSCVHSPKCGSGNRPIDKLACARLLETMLAAPAAPASPDKPVRQTMPIRPKAEPGQTSRRRGLDALPARYCVFDLETRRSADEVGGWRHADRMGLAVGVVYDSELADYVTYFEDEADQLIAHLSRCDLVVGFNTKRFDYRVLSIYTDEDLQTLPSLDLLEEVTARLGYRLSLNRLLEQTLGCAKQTDGLQALRWFKEGRLKEVADYCRRDVELTKNLFLFGLDNGYVLFVNKGGNTVRLPLPLEHRIAAVTSAGGRWSGPQQRSIDPADETA